MDTRQGAQPFDEARLHAFADGRLDAGENERVRQWLATHPAEREKVEAWRLQREALRAHFGRADDAPVPSALADAAARAQGLREDLAAWWQRAGVAAGLLLAFGLGWLANAHLGPEAGAVAARQPARLFAQQAAAAYVVYQPEQRHPVEVGAAQQEHLVQWLSKRLGRPLKVPNLTAQGYELMGGRLLPGDAGPRAQFMYQNAAGQRLTLYLGAIEGEGAHAHETAFKFLDDGPVPSFYWVDEGFGCAIAAQLPRATLQQIAEAAYKQLET